MIDEINQKKLDEATEENQDMLQSDLETLNVNVWFNKLESRLQYCLVKENAKEGFMQYKMLVLHAELLALASSKIELKEYEEEVKTLIKDLDKHEGEATRSMKESMIKYKVILKQLLTMKKSNMSLTY
jgi:hypothetical protein